MDLYHHIHVHLIGLDIRQLVGARCAPVRPLSVHSFEPRALDDRGPAGTGDLDESGSSGGARPTLGGMHDYQVNLKAELEIRQLHQKLDHLLSQQWERLVEIQEIQIELINEVMGNR